MAKNEDKGQMTAHDQSGLLGEVPASVLGPDRTAAVVKKIKAKHELKAKDGNIKMNKANVSNTTDALSKFVNR